MPDEPIHPPSANFSPGTPPPPPPVSPGYPVPPPAAATTMGLEPNIAAGLAVLFSVVSGIIFLVLEKRSQFVRFWAMQSVIFGGVLFVFNIAVWVVGFVFGSIPVVNVIVGIILFILSLVVGLGALVLYVIMLIKAFTGEEWNIPVIGKIARQQLAKLPV